MISIVIPLYNKASHIARTLESVFSQTYTDYEIVVVDDGSTDGSADIVAEISDPRIRLVRQPNAGVSAARNLGIREARGEFVALLDADDLWNPDYLATQISLTEKYPDCDVFAVGYEFCDEHGHITPTIIRNLPFTGRDGILSNYFHVASTSHPPICSITIMARKSAFEAIGGFPEGVTSGEDLLTWARLAVRNKIAYSKIVCSTYFTPTTGSTGMVPTDLKTTSDNVGRQLIQLDRDFTEKGVAEYISFWYKMRAVINLRRGNRKAAFKCAVKSLNYNPCQLKALAILPLSVMPNAVIDKIFRK